MGYVILKLFSHSVSVGLEFHSKNFAAGLEECQATIDFTRFMNDCFDALNSRFSTNALSASNKEHVVSHII